MLVGNIDLYAYQHKHHQKFYSKIERSPPRDYLEMGEEHREGGDTIEAVSQYNSMEPVLGVVTDLDAKEAKEGIGREDNGDKGKSIEHMMGYTDERLQCRKDDPQKKHAQQGTQAIEQKDIVFVYRHLHDARSLMVSVPVYNV